YELPKRLDIETTARRVYKLLSARGNTRAAGAKRRVLNLTPAAALSHMILGPVAGQIQGKRLIIVSDGILEYTPFAALPAPRTSGQETGKGVWVPLIVEHEIVSLPSASALAELRRQARDRQESPKAVAV